MRGVRSGLERVERLLRLRERNGEPVQAAELAELAAVPVEVVERYVLERADVRACWWVPTPCGKRIGFEGKLPEAYRCPSCKARHEVVWSSVELVVEPAGPAE